MVKDIITDRKVLTQKSARFVRGQDEYLIADMIDTALAHKECVGLACIQIGVPKRIIIVKQDNKFVPYINPVIVNKSVTTYTAKETCLSLKGARTVKRHRCIKLFYNDRNGKTRSKVFDGFVAQIIQHECDHLEGVLI